MTAIALVGLGALLLAATSTGSRISSISRIRDTTIGMVAVIARRSANSIEAALLAAAIAVLTACAASARPGRTLSATVQQSTAYSGLRRAVARTWSVHDVRLVATQTDSPRSNRHDSPPLALRQLRRTTG